MEPWQFIIVFGAGIGIGVILYPLARMIESEGVDRVLDAIARFVRKFFSLPVGIFRRTFVRAKGRQGADSEARKADPREQFISDTAQTIRSLLLSLASVIQRTVDAASDSSETLGDVRDTIDRMPLPDDLMEVHTRLLHEIDRVIASNSALKRELIHSQEILAAQRREIEALRTEIRIDGLTQLANRTCFDERLAEMMRIRERYGDPFTLLVIDVDRFKEINDTYGHPGGDRILKGVAYKIKSALRATDFVARFGGDEFAAILMKADAGQASLVAEKLCREIRDSRFILDGTEVRTTLSIGLAEHRTGEDAGDLLKRADRALYLAKEKGRDGAAVAD